MDEYKLKLNAEERYGNYSDMDNADEEKDNYNDNHDENNYKFANYNPTDDFGDEIDQYEDQVNIEDNLESQEQKIPYSLNNQEEDKQSQVNHTNGYNHSRHKEPNLEERSKNVFKLKEQSKILHDDENNKPNRYKLDRINKQLELSGSVKTPKEEVTKSPDKDTRNKNPHPLQIKVDTSVNLAQNKGIKKLDIDTFFTGKNKQADENKFDKLNDQNARNVLMPQSREKEEDSSYSNFANFGSISNKKSNKGTLLEDLESKWEEIEKTKSEILRRIKSFHTENLRATAINENNDPRDRDGKQNDLSYKTSRDEERYQQKYKIKPIKEEQQSRDSNCFDKMLKEKNVENLVLENNNFEDFVRLKQNELNNFRARDKDQFRDRDRENERDYDHNKFQVNAGIRHDEEGDNNAPTFLNKNNEERERVIDKQKLVKKFDGIYKLFDEENPRTKHDEKFENESKHTKGFNFELIVKQVDKQNLFKNKKELLINSLKQDNFEKNRRSSPKKDEFIYPIGGNKLRKKI